MLDNKGTKKGCKYNNTTVNSSFNLNFLSDSLSYVKITYPQESTFSVTKNNNSTNNAPLNG